MTDLINSLEALAGKVTPGDWEVESGHTQTGPGGIRYWQITDGQDAITCNQFCYAGFDPKVNAANADLICLLRNNLPTIIAALKLAELVRDEDWLVDQIRDYFPAEELAVGEHIAAAREIIAAMGEEVK